MKPLILLLAAAACMPAGAAINATGKKLADNPHFIRQEFSLNKEPRLYLYDDEDNHENCQFVILDNAFNEITKFSTPTYPEVTAEFTYRYAIDGPKDVFVRGTEENIYSYDISREDFIKDAADFVGQPEVGDIRIEEVGDEVHLYPSYIYDYYYGDTLGKKYPDFIYIWRNNDVFYYRYYYDYKDWGPTGQYEAPKTFNDSATPRPCELYPYDANCVDNDGIIISQTLFNNDDKFEWVVPVIEAVECSYTTEREIIEGKKLKCTGFRVESQNGSTISTVKFPAGLYAYEHPDFDLYLMGDKNYLIIDLYTIESEKQYYIVYEIDPNSASVKAVDAPRRAGSLKAPRHNTNVNVSLGAPAEAGCKIIVTSESGKTVMSRNIEPGTTNASIDTARLAKGTYVVSIANGKTTRENSVIVVR